MGYRWPIFHAIDVLNRSDTVPLSVTVLLQYLIQEVCVKSPGNAKTPRIKCYTQIWGRLPKVGLGLVADLRIRLWDS